MPVPHVIINHRPGFADLMWRLVRPLRPGTLGAVKTERLSEMRFAAECDLVRAMRHHQSARAVNLMRHLRDLEREMWFRGA